MKQVWVDTDAGFDDLLAVQMINQSAHYNLAGISLVAGNSELTQVIENAAQMAATFDWHAPIHVGSDLPLNGKLITAADILGPKGMHSRSAWFDGTSRDVEKTGALDAITDWMDSLDAPAPVLALGPLTNIARLVQSGCDLGKISELIFMGGSTDRGNSTAVAEFNIHADPEAADVVFRSGLPLKMIGINACRQVNAIADDVERIELSNCTNCGLLADLLAGYLSIRDKEYKEPMPLFDPVAAAALLSPQNFIWEDANIAVELNGDLTRGMTVCEFRVPKKAQANGQVAMEVEEAPVRKMIFEAFGIL